MPAINGSAGRRHRARTANRMLVQPRAPTFQLFCLSALRSGASGLLRAAESPSWQLARDRRRSSKATEANLDFRQSLLGKHFCRCVLPYENTYYCLRTARVAASLPAVAKKPRVIGLPRCSTAGWATASTGSLCSPAIYAAAKPRNRAPPATRLARARKKVLGLSLAFVS